MISAKQLAEWNALADNAMSGPWITIEDSPQDQVVIFQHGKTTFEIATIDLDGPAGHSEAYFMAEAREAVPALIDEIERLHFVLARIRDTDTTASRYRRMAREALMEEKR